MAKWIVDLGDQVEEITTGLQGTVIAVCSWLGEKERAITIQPRLLKDGVPVAYSTFNEAKVRMLSKGKV